ncbi:acetylornithine aminotransferase [Microbacterium sorbitolivorans]|uniref:Acetylornithine transaminase n=1 Tax=Microbacterium sorbitolivorans TaxID=1867410 RepID=A0A367XXF8_9MICO|nr:acetylornithine transaminase [Microbacterium sorbitolivorans]RCK58298.1 acetylornithine transaminase [Microbacterium sorbitolivorans]GGF35289.1 acetylornithine aminotransferase [Microbacterium sorbitolivorans]
MTNDWKDEAGRDLMSLGGRLANLERGKGSHVWDTEGNRFLDFLGGIAVNALGHAHPVFVEAVTQQAQRLAHVSNYFATPQQLELAARLKRLAKTGDAGRVFLANAGTEANETALKLARLHGNKHGKGTILCLNGAFHGRSTGALALTPKAAYQDPFAPLMPGIVAIDPTIEALEQAFTDDVAAIFAEPIQGEAGVVPLPDGFLARARELATERGALLILDEVQTGSGRTGEWFAHQALGVTPDAVTLAKSVAGGFPLGAMITFGVASELFYPGTHNSTFGGNPLASAVANAVLEYVEDENLLENVTARGAELREKVQGLPLVSHTRGAGLLIGIVLDKPVAADVAAAALERGLIINAPAADVIRLAPAYTIGDDEIAEFLDLFSASLDAVATSQENAS